MFKSMLLFKEKQREQNQSKIGLSKYESNKNECDKQVANEKPMGKKVTLKNKKSGNDAKQAMN